MNFVRVYLKTPNAPGQRTFSRCAAPFFLEIRQYSCEKMSCSAQKFLAAGHIGSFQIHPKYIPYIFSEDELVRFFRQVDCCHFSSEVPNRHLIMPVLFRILYCCGLRPGEVLRLEVRDVDLENGVLLVRASKNDNDRYVPMSCELAEACRKYAAKVHYGGAAHKYFFPAPNGGIIPSMNIYTNFHRFLRKAGISYGGKGKGPRVYDFRHTFAVHCLRHLVLSGKDKLP